MAAGAENDELDITPLEGGRRERTARCHVGKLFHEHVGNAPFPDSGAAHHPVLGRIQEAGEIGIGEDRRRQAFSPTRDCSVTHAPAPGLTEA